MTDATGIPRIPQPVDQPTIWNASQSLWFEQHFAFDGELLRVQIRRNAYNDQSSATVCCWSPLSRGWNHLCQLHIEALPISQASYVESSASSAVSHLFAHSAKQLLARATAILGARGDYWDQATD